MIDVLITDDKSPDYYQNEIFFGERDQWAQIHCPSYVGYHVQDVSDCSLQWDEIACYQFNKEQCANWFKLRWL